MKKIIIALALVSGMHHAHAQGASVAPAFNKDVPVGTVICSYLNFEQFSAVTDNNAGSPGNMFTTKFSKWAPADGRRVPNSQFSVITSHERIPDLRGVFVRGLNQFDAGPSGPPMENGKNDPTENRVPGSYQADELKKHSHPIVTNDDGTPVTNGNYKATAYSKHNGPTVNSEEGGTGTETRPKNVALYYYIRIN